MPRDATTTVSSAKAGGHARDVAHHAVRERAAGAVVELRRRHEARERREHNRRAEVLVKDAERASAREAGADGGVGGAPLTQFELGARVLARVVEEAAAAGSAAAAILVEGCGPSDAKRRERRHNLLRVAGGRALEVGQEALAKDSRRVVEAHGRLKGRGARLAEPPLPGLLDVGTQRVRAVRLLGRARRHQARGSGLAVRHEPRALGAHGRRIGRWKPDRAVDEEVERGGAAGREGDAAGGASLRAGAAGCVSRCEGGGAGELREE